MYCKCCIYLASLYEDIGQFRNSIKILRGALGKIVEFREEKLRKSLDSESNKMHLQQ
jgi:Tfp pilus assembly protein PilO